MSNTSPTGSVDEQIEALWYMALPVVNMDVEPNTTEQMSKEEWIAKAKQLILARENEVKNSLRARPNGRTLEMFAEFQKAIERGKTAEWHSVDYVVLNRKQYNKLVKMAEYPKVFVDEWTEYDDTQLQSLPNTTKEG